MDIVSAFETRAGRPLPDAVALRRDVGRQTLRRGEILFAQGTPSSRVYWVRVGVLKLSYVSSDGTERVREFVAEGQVFACLEALDGARPAEYSATACEACELEWLPFAALDALSQREPTWGRCLGQFALDTARHRGERERVLLTSPPLQRFTSAIRERPWLLSRVAQRDLAAYIGVTPVSLSRFKSEMGLLPSKRSAARKRP